MELKICMVDISLNNTDLLGCMLFKIKNLLYNQILPFLIYDYLALNNVIYSIS